MPCRRNPPLATALSFVQRHALATASAPDVTISPPLGERAKAAMLVSTSRRLTGLTSTPTPASQIDCEKRSDVAISAPQRLRPKGSP